MTVANQLLNQASVMVVVPAVSARQSFKIGLDVFTGMPGCSGLMRCIIPLCNLESLKRLADRVPDLLLRSSQPSTAGLILCQRRLLIPASVVQPVVSHETLSPAESLIPRGLHVLGAAIKHPAMMVKQMLLAIVFLQDPVHHALRQIVDRFHRMAYWSSAIAAHERSDCALQLVGSRSSRPQGSCDVWSKPQANTMDSWQDAMMLSCICQNVGNTPKYMLLTYNEMPPP
jgi:hypothetical protein